MTTKREYLAQKGITVGKRGRFSGAAKQALSEAEKNGIKFTAEPKLTNKHWERLRDSKLLTFPNLIW
jgi:hypothetical protein